jgi:predicted site-specific integrase-resolvase
VVRASEVEPEALYTPGEVAGMFRVDPKTVVRWIKKGKFAGHYTRTGGGHHRIYGRGIQNLAANR